MTKRFVAAANSPLPCVNLRDLI